MAHIKKKKRKEKNLKKNTQYSVWHQFIVAVSIIKPLDSFSLFIIFSSLISWLHMPETFLPEYKSDPNQKKLPIACRIN